MSGRFRHGHADGAQRTFPEPCRESPPAWEWPVAVRAAHRTPVPVAAVLAAEVPTAAAATVSVEEEVVVVVVAAVRPVAHNGVGVAAPVWEPAPGWKTNRP